MKLERKNVQAVLVESITVLCQSLGLPYTSTCSIEGLLGITLDDKDILLVNIREVLQEPSRVTRDGRPVATTVDSRTGENHQQASTESYQTLCNQDVSLVTTSSSSESAHSMSLEQQKSRAVVHFQKSVAMDTQSKIVQETASVHSVQGDMHLTCSSECQMRRTSSQVAPDEFSSLEGQATNGPSKVQIWAGQWGQSHSNIMKTCNDDCGLDMTVESEDEDQDIVAEPIYLSDDNDDGVAEICDVNVTSQVTERPQSVKSKTDQQKLIKDSPKDKEVEKRQQKTGRVHEESNRMSVSIPEPSSGPFPLVLTPNIGTLKQEMLEAEEVMDSDGQVQSQESTTRTACHGGVRVLACHACSFCNKKFYTLKGAQAHAKKHSDHNSYYNVDHQEYRESVRAGTENTQSPPERQEVKIIRKEAEQLELVSSLQDRNDASVKNGSKGGDDGDDKMASKSEEKESSSENKNNTTKSLRKRKKIVIDEEQGQQSSTKETRSLRRRHSLKEQSETPGGVSTEQHEQTTTNTEQAETTGGELTKQHQQTTTNTEQAETPGGELTKQHQRTTTNTGQTETPGGESTKQHQQTTANTGQTETPDGESTKQHQQTTTSTGQTETPGGESTKQHQQTTTDRGQTETPGGESTKQHKQTTTHRGQTETSGGESTKQDVKTTSNKWPADGDGDSSEVKGDSQVNRRGRPRKKAIETHVLPKPPAPVRVRGRPRKQPIETDRLEGSTGQRPSITKRKQTSEAESEEQSKGEQWPVTGRKPATRRQSLKQELNTVTGKPEKLHEESMDSSNKKEQCNSTKAEEIFEKSRRSPRKRHHSLENQVSVATKKKVSDKESGSSKDVSPQKSVFSEVLSNLSPKSIKIASQCKVLNIVLDDCGKSPDGAKCETTGREKQAAPSSEQLKYNTVGDKHRQNGNDTVCGRAVNIPLTKSPAVRKKVLYRCGLCQCDFRGIENIKRHMSVLHLQERAHICEQRDCNMAYPQSQILKVHEGKHSGQKLHVCSICSVMFTNLKAMLEHKQNHDIESPYCCPLCGVHFKRRDVLKDHIYKHTNEGPFSCEICGHSFQKRPKLLAHVAASSCS